MVEQNSGEMPRIDYMEDDPRSTAGFKAAVEGGVAIPRGEAVVIVSGVAPHVAAKDRELAMKFPNSSWSAKPKT